MTFIEPKRKKAKRKPKVDWNDLDLEDLSAIEKRWSITYGALVVKEAQRSEKMTKQALKRARARKKRGLKYIG